MENKRPDPDLLLDQIKLSDEEKTENGKKGRLKIFLGYCAGVGKTYRMLQETVANKKNGVDAVIALVETHNRKDTEKLLEGLEIIPRKKIEYSGITLYEMDIDAVIKRNPSLVLVDEFAHTNAPGLRHEKRYQDVEELLKAGINVFTTLNIQHIESLVDVVHQISGITVTETVPDKILELSDEVELVDLTPEKLIERMQEGKVYIPKKAEQAMRQFFKKGNLLALRELSLHYTAKQVDDEARLYMEKHAISGPWPVGARLLVSISTSPSSERLLRFTHRIAQDMYAEWYAVYVESPQQIEPDEKARIQLDKNVRLIEELGGNFVTLQGSNVADEILNFAKENKVTLIVAGSSKRTLFDKIFKGYVLDNLIKKSGSINVLITGNESQSKSTPEKYIFFTKTEYKPYILCFFMILATVLFGLLLRSKLEPINVVMLFLLPAIASGILWGIRVGIFASLMAVIAFDFFFIPPYHTFRISDIKYLPSFAVFIIVSILTSFLAKSMRLEAESSRHRERFVYSIYSFTRAIMTAEDLDDILNKAVKNISEAFESDVIILLPDKTDKLRLVSSNVDNLLLSDTEKAVAEWVFKNGKSAGKSTATLSSAIWYYLPLMVQDKVIGALGIRPISNSKFLTPEQDQLLESFASIAALALRRVMI